MRAATGFTVATKGNWQGARKPGGGRWRSRPMVARAVSFAVEQLESRQLLTAAHHLPGGAPNRTEGAQYTVAGYLTADAENTYDVAVNWGDGSTSSFEAVSYDDGDGNFTADWYGAEYHAWGRPGTKTVTVTATNQANSSDTATGTYTVTVLKRPPRFV